MVPTTEQKMNALHIQADVAIERQTFDVHGSFSNNDDQPSLLSPLFDILQCRRL